MNFSESRVIFEAILFTYALMSLKVRREVHCEESKKLLLFGTLFMISVMVIVATMEITF